jgi:hypothetical protein
MVLIFANSSGTYLRFAGILLHLSDNEYAPAIPPPDPLVNSLIHFRPCLHLFTEKRVPQIPFVCPDSLSGAAQKEKT